MSSMIGSSAWPLAVSAYSTRGGTSPNVWRSTMPSSSSARRRSERVRGEMPDRDRSSSQKREWPSARSRISSRVHFPQMMSAVWQTGHVGSTGILPTLYRVKRPRRRRGMARSADQKVAERVVVAAPATHHGGDPAIGGLDELPAGARERHLQRLARTAPDQVLHLEVGPQRGRDALRP